ncbi:MAG: hypothetical protein QM783_08555 [Phycisphaerales bacterium]
MTGQPPSTPASDREQVGAASLGPAAVLRRRIVPWVQAFGFLMLGLAVYMVVRQHDPSGAICWERRGIRCGTRRRGRSPRWCCFR